MLVETALLAAIVLLVMQRSFKPEKKPLTEKARKARKQLGLFRLTGGHRRSTRYARSGSRSHSHPS